MGPSSGSSVIAAPKHAIQHQSTIERTTVMSTTVDLRKRYADRRTGKVNLYKVVLSKGVKG